MLQNYFWLKVFLILLKDLRSIPKKEAKSVNETRLNSL